jgi:2-dehydropantoate 2-reductase
MGNSSPSFAIMGSGGVGGYFGAALARAGYETTFIARGAHLSTMLENGLSITKLGETSVQQVKATDTPDDIGSVDYILFSVKLWDTIEAAKQIAPMVGDKTMILSLQNGISSEEVLIAHYGADQVLGGVAEISAIIKEPGHIDCRSPFARIFYGEMGEPAPTRIEQLDNALKKAGIEHGHVPEISSRIWKKFIFLVGLSALTTATDRTIGEIREDETDRTRLYQVMDETLSIAKAKGIALPDDLLSPIMAFVDELPHGMRASMAEDLRAGRQLELDWLSGKVVALGQSLGIETPVNSEIVTEIRKQISA